MTLATLSDLVEGQYPSALYNEPGDNTLTVRICVGRHVADASVWYAISGMLALFNFSKAIDTDGNEIDFEPRWSSGIAMCVVNPLTHLMVN